MRPSKELISYWEDYFHQLVGRKPKSVWERVSNGDSYSLPPDAPEGIHCSLKYPLGLWYSEEDLDIVDLCLKRHINSGHGSKTAIFFANALENRISPMTYDELYAEVNSLARLIDEHKKAERNTSILVIANHSLETAAGMLAFAASGIHFSTCFGDIHDASLQRRIKDLKPDLIWLDKRNSLFRLQFETSRLCGYVQTESDPLNKAYENILLLARTGKLEGEGILSRIANDSETMFTLPTSGSTGRPKYITHSKAGYLVYAKSTCDYFWELCTDDVMFTASDAGWINGHTYALFGPLLCGASTVITDSPSELLNSEWLISILERCRVTALYLPVSIIRHLRALAKEVHLKDRDLALRKIGSMGEPLAPTVRQWFSRVFLGSSDRPVINTYFQTETGGILVAQKASEAHQERGASIGVVPSFINMNVDKGELKLCAPWPGSAVYLSGAHESLKSYLDRDGNFCLNDSGELLNNRLVIGGRTDDIIIVQGKNISSCEIEASILAFSRNIIEAAVFCVEVSSGIVICAALVLSEGQVLSPAEKDELRNTVYTALDIPVIVRQFFTLDRLPKNKSGKILRKNIRHAYQLKVNDQNGRLGSGNFEVEIEGESYSFEKI